MARLADRRSLVASLTLALAACGGDQEPSSEAGSLDPAGAPSAGAVERSPQRPEFEAIAKALREGSNPYLGYSQVLERQERLGGADLSVVERFTMLLELARIHLQFGEVDDAILRIDEAEKVAAGNPGARPHLLRMRGLAYMRQAEVQNCIQRHNRECCIFPLAGGGEHALREPALAARASYEAFLELQPDFTIAWLLNVIAMALGDHPQGVPERYRIPPQAFASKADIGTFVDVAPALGVDPFNNCGGVIAEDFDGDGYLDIVTSTFDPSGPLHYYRNGGDGTFEDRSALSRLDDQLGGLNLLGADYDNDGDVDILVLRGAWLHSDGEIRNSLLRNEGDGTFTDVTRTAGLAEPARPTQAAVWGDFDNDGDLDLFIGNESSSSSSDATIYSSQFYRNEGDGTFSEIGEQAGLATPSFAKGVSAGDYDNDGDLDLYVSNVGPNRLYRNDGGMKFTDVASDLGVSKPERRSFATWFFDYDNDGWLDLFVADYLAKVEDIARDAMGAPNPAIAPCLYRNRGDGTFTNVALQVGLGHAYLPMGANFGDVDNDGWLDIYLATGDPAYETLMPNVMLLNEAGQGFVDITTSSGLGHLQKGHGVAFADFDADGDQDIYNQLGGFYPGDRFRNALFRNPGNANHHLKLELVGEQSNRQGMGARVTLVVETPGGPREIHRAVGSVSSFGGSPMRQEIGLGDALAIESLTVRWPRSGIEHVYRDVPMDAFVQVREGSDELEVGQLRPVELAGDER